MEILLGLTKELKENLMKCSLKSNGFTLIELIISIAILGIIIIAFLNMFLFGVVNVIGAGDKGEAYNNAQLQMENRIASKSIDPSDPLLGDSLTLNFTNAIHGSQTYVIPGGWADIVQTVSDKTSNLNSFIPLVPTINIVPSVVTEGRNNDITITVTGQFTHFASGNTSFQLLNSAGSLVLSGTVSVSSATQGTISFNRFLMNENSEYFIKVSTTIPSKPTEIAKAKLTVLQPDLISISVNKLFVYSSDDTVGWVERSNQSSFPDITAKSFKAITYGNNSYLSVGDDGNVLIGKNKSVWVLRTDSTLGDLNDVAWSPSESKFYAVNATGKIYSSTNGDSWSVVNEPNYSLNVLAVGPNQGTLIAAGSSGQMRIRKSSLWTNVDLPGSEAVVALFVSDDLLAPYYVAILSNGAIYRSTDTVNWVNVYNAGNLINDMAFVNNKLIAVGNNGYVYQSPDGNSWSSALYVTGGTKHLRGIAKLAGTNTAVICGDGIIMQSDNYSSWTIMSGTGTNNFLSISGK